MVSPLKLVGKPGLRNPSLVVGWDVDAGRLGARVTDYLIRKLACPAFGEIEPVDFFPLTGVSIEESQVQFPESVFYACPAYDLVIFKSPPPASDWHRFLNLILDAAVNFNVREVYTIGGMVTLAAHTTPREMRGTFSSPDLKTALGEEGLTREWDYETPPGQRPTLSSFFLWTARGRNIPGVNLWIAVPFYLVSVNDPRAEKRALEFLQQRCRFSLDMTDLDEVIGKQAEALAALRRESSEIDEAVSRLETNQPLTEEQSQLLVKEVEEYLTERG